MFSIKWTDGTAKWLVEFEDFKHARRYLNSVFYEAILYDDLGNAIGGVRAIQEHERKTRRHKWFRWIDGDKPAVKVTAPPNAFMEELKKV